MIEKLKIKGASNNLDYSQNDPAVVEKINEIIDHLNKAHGGTNFHLNVAPITKGLKGINKEIKDDE